VAEAYADREIEMTQEFSLDQKKVTILAALVLALVLLVFIAGYLSGTIVGLPETDEQPVALAPAKSQPKPPVVAIPVHPVEETPESEEVAEVAEPEEIAEPEPEEERVAEKLYSVQVGAVRTHARAEDHKQQLIAKGYQPYIYQGANSKGVMWYTLRIGDFDDVDEAIAAAREFRTLENAAVVMTHFDSLMMVRDDDGKRIEIAPPEKATLVPGAADKKSEAEEDGASEDGETEEGPDESGAVADEVETAADEPEPVADEPEPVIDNPEPVVDEPEPVADEPEPVADEPEPVADEPEPVVDEPEPVEDWPGPVADELDPVVGQLGSTTENQVTFALPVETPPAVKDKTTGGESVGGLIAAAESYQYAVQVGAFLNGDNAAKFTEKLRGLGYPAYVFHYTDTSGNVWNAVRTGDYKDPNSAKNAAEEFEEKEQITAIVTRIDTIKRVF